MRTRGGFSFRQGIRITVATAVVLATLCGLTEVASATLPGKNGSLLISTRLPPGESVSTYLYTETTSGKSTKILGGADSFYGGSVSPNGKSLVFSRYPGYQLWLGPFSHPENATAITPAIEDTNWGEAVFAPDGKSIYYSERAYLESGPVWNLHRYTIKTKKSKDYKVNRNMDFGLVDVSPNGRLLAYNRGSDEDRSAIRLMDTKTGKSRTLKLPTPAIPGGFSPDSKWIVYTGPVKDGWEVFKARLDGKGVKRLTRGGEINFGPVFSPDGKQVAFTQGADATRKIGIINLKTGKTKYLKAPGDYTDIDQWMRK